MQISNNKYLTVRNTTGYYQIDPGKFRGPGSSAECMDDDKFIQCMIKTGSWPGHPAADQWNGQRKCSSSLCSVFFRSLNRSC